MSSKSLGRSANSNERVLEAITAQIEQKGLALMPAVGRKASMESRYQRTPSPDLLLELSEGMKRF